MKAAEITHTNTTPKAINLREADRTLSSAVELFINWILSGMSLQAKASKLVRSRAVRARASYPPNVKFTRRDEMVDKLIKVSILKNRSKIWHLSY